MHIVRSVPQCVRFQLHPKVMNKKSLRKQFSTLTYTHIYFNKKYCLKVNILPTILLSDKQNTSLAHHTFISRGNDRNKEKVLSQKKYKTSITRPKKGRCTRLSMCMYVQFNNIAKHNPPRSDVKTGENRIASTSILLQSRPLLLPDHAPVM